MNFVVLEWIYGFKYWIQGKLGWGYDFAVEKQEILF